jgi:hypothetical protein
MQMGLGKLGLPTTRFKRKFRWTFALDVCGGKKVPEWFVKSGARPNLEIEEQEINFLNAKTWIPGKGTWQTINIVYYDVIAAGEDAVSALLSWLASVYDFTNPEQLNMGATTQDYSGTGTLTLYDGCGSPMEIWTLKDAWPTGVDFGELDMSSSEECTISLTLRYTKVKYQPKCGGGVSPCPCTSC